MRKEKISDLFDECVGARDAEEKGVCVALGEGGETVLYHQVLGLGARDDVGYGGHGVFEMVDPAFVAQQDVLRTVPRSICVCVFGRSPG